MYANLLVCILACVHSDLYEQTSCFSVISHVNITTMLKPSVFLKYGGAVALSSKFNLTVGPITCLFHKPTLTKVVPAPPGYLVYRMRVGEK